MLNEQIKRLLEAQGKTQAELARHVGVSPQAVGHWVAGDYEPIGKNRRAVASFFGVDESDLLFGPHASRRGGRVPIISWHQAAVAKSVVNNNKSAFFEEWINVTSPVNEHTYALSVTGDSMVNPNGWPSFPEGTTIVVEPDLEPIADDFVIVRRGQSRDTTFKQLSLDAGMRYLKPLNPRYPIVQMAPGDEVIGVVREFGARLR